LGDWPQSPIPNPQSPSLTKNDYYYFIIKYLTEFFV